MTLWGNKALAEIHARSGHLTQAHPRAAKSSSEFWEDLPLRIPRLLPIGPKSNIQPVETFIEIPIIG